MSMDRYPYARGLRLVAPVILGALLATFTACQPPPPPPILELPTFTLIDSQGRPSGSEQLAGSVYVADFFFTRCGSICPLLTGAMLQLQQRFEDDDLPVRLLSITVDPEFDRPPVLAAYAESYGIDTGRWTLLTGDREQIGEVVENGFKVAIGDPTIGEGGLFDIAHASRFFLVDGEGQVRGIYEIDAAGLDRLERDARRLAR